MTGFGTASFRMDGIAFEVEVRSVNHRHLDARVRLPRPLSSLESEVRARIQTRFGRGKFDCSVVTPEGPPPAALEVDLEAARGYLRGARALHGEGVDGDLSVADLLGLPGVARFHEPEISTEVLRGALLDALNAALERLVAMRVAEGEALERDLLRRIARVSDLADELEARAGLVVEAARERLRRRTAQLQSETGLLDEARLHQEIVLIADRLDVAEEIVRLRSHVDQFRKLVDAGARDNPVGRRLEFLLQELGREANTIGSKASDAPVAHLIVELKNELERLREQVQNVE
jgi:uncharacterized protein (TIGR00255 family)